MSVSNYFEYVIYWGGVDWKSTPPNIDEEKFEQLLESMMEPDEGIFRALEMFYLRYYPDETKESVKQVIQKYKEYLSNISKENGEKKTKNTSKQHRTIFDGENPISLATLPWVGHMAAYTLFKKNSLPQYREILEAKLKEDWLLSWHWRALLPTIFKWEESIKNKPFILKICQIRSWELSLYYSNKNSGAATTAKTLIRPPIFGISHRIFRWDFYRYLYDEDIKRKINEEIDSREPFRLANILGRNDSSYTIKSIKTDYGENKNFEISYKVELKHELNIRPEIIPPGIDRETDRKIEDDFSKNYSTVSKPDDLIEIPTFYPDKKSIKLLLASDNYCNTLSQLTELMNDPHAKSVLLIAPPGSGKEALAKAAFMCRDIRTDFDEEGNTKKGDFCATSLAGLSANEASRILFDLGMEGTKIFMNSDSKELDVDNLKKSNSGLAFKSLNGALFIDEIDKTDKDIKAMLLRFLESEEITTPSSRVIRVPSKNFPLIIFSGSANRKEVLGQPPADFWTRISHIIEMSHPLDINDLKAKRRIIKSYVWLFWYSFADDYLRKKKLVYEEKKIKDEKSIYLPLLKVFQKLHDFLISKIIIDSVSDELSEVIMGKNNTLVSIRSIRMIVSKAIFMFVDYILYSKSEDSPIEKLKLRYDKDKNESINSPEDWFKALAKIIYKDGDKNYIKEEYEFLESIRRIIRDSASQIL